MLMAHQDVVSADPAGWTHPPFEGKIVDGFIWGRGTLDIKNQLIGIIPARSRLAAPRCADLHFTTHLMDTHTEAADKISGRGDLRRHLISAGA